MFSTMLFIFLNLLSPEQQRSWGQTDTEIDEIKRIFIETDFWLLCLTFVVSLLHGIFDILAFKNDVEHWRNKDSLEGTSLKGILINVFSQSVITAYLMYNDTSIIVLASSALGVLIEVWKAAKAFKVQGKGQNKELEAQTRDFDDRAFRYISLACIPLGIGYICFSLLYETHRSWYGFLLSCLVGFVYAFGNS
jgi:hypothetical protein